MEALQSAVVAVTAARNNQSRVAGFSPVQLVFGKDHGSLEENTWIQSETSSIRAVAEGAQVMFWEPPSHRRGLARRLQDQISWLGPAVVAAIERKEGAIKKVWIRYQNNLKGVPLEFVRLAVAEEQEASAVSARALKDLEKQMSSGRVNAEVDSSSSSSSSSSC